jgi:4-amino-4-deoxy-L-arabinose transferase-like glycosyltransferase
MTHSNSPKKHAEAIWLIGIIVLGMALRLGAIGLYNHAPESDEVAYRAMALNLVDGIGVVDSMGNLAHYNAGYPLFVLAPIFAFFRDNLFLVRLVHVLLGGISIALCYAIAKEAGAGKIGRLLAALLWAAYLPSSVYVVYLFKEHLMIPLMLGIVWCSLRLANRRSWGSVLTCGMLFGLVALTGNAALSLAATAAVALAFTPSSARQKLGMFGVAGVLAIVVASPWIIRNARVLGTPVLNTNGGFNFYLGNNPKANGMFVSIADTPRAATWEGLRRRNEAQAAEILKWEAVDWIKANPTRFVTLALQKAVYFWTPPFHDGKGQQSRAESVIRILWAMQFLLVAVLALAGLGLSRLRTRVAVLLWTTVASYTAVHMLFYVIFRYREPAMPYLCVLAALTVEALVARTSTEVQMAPTSLTNSHPCPQ